MTTWWNMLGWKDPTPKKTKPPAVKIHSFDALMTSMPDIGYEILKKQHRYEDALNLCRSNKAVGSICKTPRSEKILKFLEADNCFAVFLSTISQKLKYSIQYKEKTLFRSTEPSVNDPNLWDEFRKAHPDMPIRLVRGLNDVNGWKNHMEQLLINYPVTLLLELNVEYKVGENTQAKVLCQTLFNEGKTLHGYYNTVLQTLSIHIMKLNLDQKQVRASHKAPANTMKTFKMSYGVHLSYNRWMNYFPRGFSRRVQMFSAIFPKKLYRNQHYSKQNY